MSDSCHQLRIPLFACALCGWILSLPAEEINIRREKTDPAHKHWAYIAPQKGPLPEVKRKEWVNNPIDFFVLAKMEAAGLEPSARAARTQLLRRVSFDLTGLPPTPEEIEEFEMDVHPLSFEKAVERLLSSPAYGERMAQHWLDLARYADTDGYNDDFNRAMWPYRDWVIHAFNENKPFDQFTIEQLAGDLLEKPTREQVLATAFNRNNMTTTEGGADAEEYLIKYAVDRVTTYSTVWLGSTLACAECHDHKYDPFTQREFYSLMAFFNQVPEKGLDRDPAPPFLELPSSEQEKEQKRLEEEKERIAKEIKSQEVHMQMAFESWEEKLEVPRSIEATEHPLYRVIALTPELRFQNEKSYLSNHFRGHFSPVALLDKKLAEVKGKESALRKSIRTIRVMRDQPERKPTHLLIRGDYRKKGEQVRPGVPKTLSWNDEVELRNRLDLGSWTVDPRNPITARVVVNRFWEMLFGTGLVRTANEFGAQGELPSHAELLDWLARDFVESGWDVKRMLRLMVLSATYQQDSKVIREHWEKDPRNRLLSRFPRVRLPAEMLRDNVLALSGLLDRGRSVGGPSVFPYHPSGLWSEKSSVHNTNEWTQSHGADLYRRTIYTFWKRSVPHPAVMAFDVPSREICTVSRDTTCTPLQALIMLNETAYMEAARVLAEKMLKEGSGQDEENKVRQLAWVFKKVLGRNPKTEENVRFQLLADRSVNYYARNLDQAQELQKMGEYPGAGDLRPEKLAGWTIVVNTILNMDETMTKE